MKYPALKRKNTDNSKTLTIDGFDGGINCENGEYAKEDSILSECENMHFEDGALKTRDAFCANEDSIIEMLEDDDIVYLPFKISETVYYKNSVPYSLAYICTGNDIEANLRFFLVNSSGNVLPAGSIYIHRVDFETFYIPTNVFFVIADKIGGIGVFAYVARDSINDSVYDVYEASEDFGEWNPYNLVYAPTVRINGRGERYEEAKGYVGLDYPEPQRLEEPNLLSGTYRCYFTSDDLSSVFRLPYGNLGQISQIECRVYSSSENYTEWVVRPATNSAVSTIGGVNVTLYINRDTGTLRFYRQSEDYCVPIMPNCKLNNIMVIAYTDEILQKNSIITSKGAVTLNNRIYFYGNRFEKNCIYCAKISNPMYVPESSRLYLGDITTPVTALRVQNGKLIAFKSGETYRVITSFEDDTIQKETVLPESTIYVRSDTLSAQTIDNNIGCVSADTICLCGSRLVWLSSDNSVYALATTTYGNTTNIYRISQPLGEKIKHTQFDISKAYAVTKDGKYMLFFGDTVFVMNYRVRGFGYSRTYYAEDDKLKSPSWYVWRLPENAGIYGAANLGSNTLAYSAFKNGKSFYVTTLCGFEDTVITSEADEISVVNIPINASFITKTLEFSDRTCFKRIDSIFVSGNSSSPLKLTFSDGERKYSYRIRFKDGKGYLRMNTGIPFAGGLKLYLSGNKPFEIRNIVIDYKLLAKRG